MLNAITTRHANQDDVPLILSFICKKADFDRSMGAFTGILMTTEDRLRDTLFKEMPFAKVLLAQSQQVVGFALYYFRYSSYAAQPSLWLDDLYVDSQVRSKGIGTILMICLARIAKENDCTHIAWTASINNVRGINFYRKIGAEIIESKNNKLFFQADAQVIDKLVKQVK